jgi:hypothetical protein
MVAGKTGKLEVSGRCFAMSALGQKRTSEHVRPMSHLPPKADIAVRDRHVRFVPKADITLRHHRSITIWTPVSPLSRRLRWKLAS